MLTKPSFNKGYWVYTETGLHIYDGSNRLYKTISPDKALIHGSIIFENDFYPTTVQYGDKGINNDFETEEFKQEKESQLKIYNSQCTCCEKKLPKKYYKVNDKKLCGRCYKKEDTFMNRIIVK